jgi:hypothetical protein
MNPDFLDIIRALSDAETRFIIVGAYALNVYINPRATGALDIWVEPTPENALKIMAALREFGPLWPMWRNPILRSREQLFRSAFPHGESTC